MIGKDVLKASKLLEQGELVAIPTETVYGLAANALSPKAVAKIYEVKNRPSFNPLILHIANTNEVKKYVSSFPVEAQILAKTFWPGALSILLPKSNLVPDLVTAGSDKVVLRVPKHPLTLELLSLLNFPVAAPSANISNTVSPTSAQHVADGLGNNISYILDGGDCTVGVESTIVEVSDGTVIIYREGGISREEIETRTNLIVVSNTETKIRTPGQLEKHYSTTKPLYIVDSIDDYIESHPKCNVSALLYEPKSLRVESFLLSESYNYAEIANNLFRVLRRADQSESNCIIVEPIKEQGIGRAIADRLNRAATQTP